MLALLSALLGLWATLSVAALSFRADYYYFDLIANFAHWTVFLLALSALCFAAAKQRRVVAGFALLLLIHLPFLSEYYHRAAYCPRGGTPPLKVLSFNLFEINSRKGEVVDWLIRNDADLLLLLEINRKWSSELSRMESSYPYALKLNREELPDPVIGNFGLVLYSKYPLDGEIIFDPASGAPFVSARIEVGASALRFVGVHTFAPLTEGFWLADKILLERALAEIRPGEEAILAGDFNSTPTGAAFHRIKQAKLLPAGRDRAIEQTLRIYGVGALQVDHVFVTPGIEVCSDDIGPFLGSDHRPILSEVRLKGS